MTSEIEYESKVGSKGEIFLKKKYRDIMNLHPSSQIIVSIIDNTIIIKKKEDFLDLVEQTPIKYDLTVKDHKEDDKEFNESLEN